MQKTATAVFSPVAPPDLEHASTIREEAFDWLDAHYAGVVSFKGSNVLRMVGERQRRWLTSRLRDHGIGSTEGFDTADAADALTVLFLRSRGVKFRDAVDAVVGRPEPQRSPERRYSGIWNRLIDIALKRLRRRLTARLLGAAVFALLLDANDHPNCLVVVKRHGPEADRKAPEGAANLTHDQAYRTILERPTPSCWVLSPFREVLFLDRDQLPTRAEVATRSFVRLRVETDRQVYELLLGTMSATSISPSSATLRFVGRILDIVYLDFEEFLRVQSSRRFEAASVPALSTSDDLQLWLVTQLIDTVYPGSLCEISEGAESSSVARVLATSVVRPWEPSRWDPPKASEMLSGYAGLAGIPLVVESVEHPWTSVIKSVEPEMSYLESKGGGANGYSAVALPIILSAGGSIGALYVLMPRVEPPQADRLDIEVRVLTVLSRIVGEIIERQRAAIQTANVSAHIATYTVLDHQEFRAALLELLERRGAELSDNRYAERDVRLPFLLLSAHGDDSDEFDPADSARLKSWLAETLRHLEWRSFVRSHWPTADEDLGEEGFIGEVPDMGVMIALGRLVSKDELDRIRNGFSTVLRRISPTNSPVKLVGWVLDVPARRMLDAHAERDVERLADDVERWALDVASVVDDVGQSYLLAHEQGDWDASLRRVRQALQKPGARTNSYLRRIAADCAFSLGDWPSALRYAREGAALSRSELGSGTVRSVCQEADAYLCQAQPIRAWDLYTESAAEAPTHPLPRYYRGQALLLMARLLKVYEDELRRSTGLGAEETQQIDVVLNTLADGAMDDLTSAADLLDRWGLIPESYQYRNFHLVPTLMGQGLSYMLTRQPGPAAARLQGARRSFPKDDLFFREFIFAKCWEQGLHQRYGELLLSPDASGWAPLRDRLHDAFGEPPIILGA